MMSDTRPEDMQKCTRSKPGRIDCEPMSETIDHYVREIRRRNRVRRAARCRRPAGYLDFDYGVSQRSAWAIIYGRNPELRDAIRLDGSRNIALDEENGGVTNRFMDWLLIVMNDDAAADVDTLLAHLDQQSDSLSRIIALCSSGDLTDAEIIERIRGEAEKAVGSVPR
jgi:hypothetical protein